MVARTRLLSELVLPIIKMKYARYHWKLDLNLPSIEVG
jgi:hypothetical protein